MTSIKLLARLDGLKRVNSSRSPPPPLRAPSPSHHSNGIQTLVKHPSGTYRLVQAGKRPRPCAIQCIACITLDTFGFCLFLLQLVRPFASAAKQGAATRTTTLSNGFTIATEENPNAGAATVGVWIDAGSRLESAQTHGVANLLGRVAFNVRRIGQRGTGNTTRM